MASSVLKSFVGAFAAGALFMSSTAAVAAGTDGATPQQISPWAALTVLSGGAPAAAVCGAAVAAAQAAPTGCVLPVMDAPPPPPMASAPPPPPVPLEPVAAGYGVTPLLASLAAIAAGVGLFFLVKGHHHGNVQPISPG